MNASKPSGRRLRRYLGTLLAVGFGAAWWSFVPPARAAAAEVAVVTQPRVVKHLVKRPEVVHPPTIRMVKLVPVKHVPHHVHCPHPRPTPPVEPPIVTTPLPTPVIDPIPVIEVTPVIDPPPVDEPRPLPHIRTRSS